MKTPTQIADNIARHVVQDVAELPDRTSPEEWPEAMIVTDSELYRIVTERVMQALTGETA